MLNEKGSFYQELHAYDSSQSFTLTLLMIQIKQTEKTIWGTGTNINTPNTSIHLGREVRVAATTRECLRPLLTELRVEAVVFIIREVAPLIVQF